MLRVKEHGAIVAEIPNRALTDEAPVYQRPMSEPDYLKEARQLDLEALASRLPPRDDSGAVLMRLLASPTIASKRWAYRQYDHMVRTNTINLPGLGAGVVRIKGTDRALAMSVDGNGRYCYLDPRRGAMLAVAEAARNVACAGARPLGATNCLNFGNPERPGDHVAVRPGGRRHRRGLPGARRPDHRRQRQPLQRDRRQRHLPHAGDRRRRSPRSRRSRRRQSFS